jgi:hypothetical protein
LLPIAALIASADGLANDGLGRHFLPVADQKRTAEMQGFGHPFEVGYSLHFGRELPLPPHQGKARNLGLGKPAKHGGAAMTALSIASSPASSDFMTTLRFSAAHAKKV